jgi:hypothetical protein
LPCADSSSGILLRRIHGSAGWNNLTRALRQQRSRGLGASRTDVKFATIIREFEVLSLGSDGIQRLFALIIGLLLLGDVLAISASPYLVFSTINKLCMGEGLR